MSYVFIVTLKSADITLKLPQTASILENRLPKYKSKKLDTDISEHSIAQSIAESFVSIYNIHTSKLCPIEEDTAEDEIQMMYKGKIALNIYKKKYDNPFIYVKK